jgi:hypothetical protein
MLGIALIDLAKPMMIVVQETLFVMNLSVGLGRSIVGAQHNYLILLNFSRETVPEVLGAIQIRSIKIEDKTPARLKVVEAGLKKLITLYMDLRKA